MTKNQAQLLLRSPKFGDPDCIAAVQRLADEPEVQRIRTLLVGKFVVCGACGGTSDNCNVCNAEGCICISRQLAESWELDILREVLREYPDLSGWND